MGHCFFMVAQGADATMGCSGSSGNEFSKSAPASREERVSESAGGVAGIGFMTSWVGETGGRLAQNIAKSEFFRST